LYKLQCFNAKKHCRQLSFTENLICFMKLINKA